MFSEETTIFKCLCSYSNKIIVIFKLNTERFKMELVSYVIKERVHLKLFKVLMSEKQNTKTTSLKLLDLRKGNDCI